MAPIPDEPAPTSNGTPPPAASILTRPAPEPDHVLRYADHEDGIIDLYLPPHAAERRTPLAIVIHGGYWRAKYDRKHLRPLSRALADRGYAVALPEFRRIDGGGGEWPVIGADIEAMLGKVRVATAQHAPIDPQAPYRLMGHSAGGHLALWAGLRAGAEHCRNVIALAPVADMYEAAARHLSNDAAQILLGGSPEQQPGNYVDANPATYLPGTTPVTVIHGDADSDVPIELSRNLAAAHPEIDYREIPGADHFALVDPLHPVFRDIVAAALDGPPPSGTR